MTQIQAVSNAIIGENETMKMLSKIKAFFHFRDQEAEMEVSAAEIKQGKVFLHPIEDAEHVYCIKTDAVDIIISPHENIREGDVEILDVKKREAEKEDRKKEEVENRQKGERAAGERRTLLDLRPKMKKVTFTLYEDEYDMLMTSIRDNGYRKTEFLLACVSAAKKNSMEATYRKYAAEHDARRKEIREKMQQAKKQSYINQNEKVS